MASSTDMKGFFRQRKKNGGGIAKGTSNKSKRSSNQSPKHATTLGSDVSHPSVLIDHASPDGQDEYDANEEILRQFDMNMAYGPCLGMTRLARWERATSLGLNPPKDVEHLLRSAKVPPESLWDGRV